MFPYKLSKYAFTGKGWTCSSFLKYSGWWGWPFFDRFPAHSHRAWNSSPMAIISRRQSFK